MFMVRSTVDPGRRSEVEAAIEGAFAALAGGRRQGVRAAGEVVELRGDPTGVGPRATASMTTGRFSPERCDLRGVVHDG
jgi:hypothetical protein